MTCGHFLVIGLGWELLWTFILKVPKNRVRLSPQVAKLVEGFSQKKDFQMGLFLLDCCKFLLKYFKMFFNSCWCFKKFHWPKCADCVQRKSNFLPMKWKWQFSVDFWHLFLPAKCWHHLDVLPMSSVYCDAQGEKNNTQGLSAHNTVIHGAVKLAFLQAVEIYMCILIPRNCRSGEYSIEFTFQSGDVFYSQFHLIAFWRGLQCYYWLPAQTCPITCPNTSAYLPNHAHF